jgi:Rhs element Vgr protein
MGIPVATITCAGKELDPDFQVLELEVRRELNRIPEARLVLLDGDVAQSRFEVSDSELFVPGKEVTIALRWEGDKKDTKVFKGLVVRHGVESRYEGSQLRVELKDAAFKLTRQRKSAVHREQRDDEVIGKLIRAAGLKAGALAAGNTVHKELVQYHASDWDFIVSRADVQGLVVDVHQGQVGLAKMQPSGAAKATLDWGQDEIHEFDLQIDGAPQWAELDSLAWDPAAQKLRGPEKAKQPAAQGGNLKPRDVAQALGGDKDTLLHAVDMASTELQAWADARMQRSRLAFLRGRVVIDGDAARVPLDLLKLEGIGKRFNGKALVSGVVHRMDSEGWKTELLLGLAPDAYAHRPDIAELPAAGLLPAITGLQVAVVAGFEDDPSGEHRIRLKLPALDDNQGEVWARLLRPDAGKDRGMAFWPEAGDEVVIGFLDGDPRQPIVLGAMYGSVNTPPAYAGKPSDDNKRRALVSRAGAVIGFDDEKVQISITTPGGQEIMLDDDAKLITLKDQHGNQISLDDKGITLKSASDFTIDAAGKVVIKGSEVDVQ